MGRGIGRASDRLRSARPPTTSYSPLFLPLLTAIAIGLVLSACSDLGPEGGSEVNLIEVGLTSSETLSPRAPTSTVPAASNLPPALPPSKLGDDPDLNVLAGLCFGGDLASCDTLYETSFVGSR